MNEFIGHSYVLKEWDCYSLVCKFHNITPIEYTDDRDIFKYSIKDLDKIFDYKCSKITLDKLATNDIIVFAAKNNSLLHFGIYLAHNKILHVYKDSVSHIEDLSDKNRERMYCGLRKI